MSAKNEITELKNEIEAYKSQIKQFEKGLQEKQGSEISKREQELFSSYRTAKKIIISIILLFLLMGIIIIFTRVKSIANLISQYACYFDKIIIILVVAIFIAVPVYAIIKCFRYRKIKDKIAEVKSPSYIKNFFCEISKEKSVQNEFTESKAYDYIFGKQCIIIKILFKIGIKFFAIETVNFLNDIFINNLLQKQLIEIGHAEKLDRYYKIKSKPENN